MQWLSAGKIRFAVFRPQLKSRLTGNAEVDWIANQLQRLRLAH